MDNSNEFKKDLGNEIIKTLNDCNIKYTDDTGNFDEILLTYLSVVTKLIPVKPRTVKISNELDSKLKDTAYPEDKKNSINKIIKKLIDGKNINGCLSKTYINRPLDSDRFLDDWGIYHLHLSGCDEDFFNLKRNMTEDLLMAVILNSKAYLIDVTDHDPDIWYDERFIRTIIENNWQNELCSVIYKCEDQPLDVKVARKNNLNQLGYNYQGKIYVPINYSGYTFSGTSTKALNAKISVTKQIYYDKIEYDRMKFYPFCTYAICKVFDKNNKWLYILIQQ